MRILGTTSALINPSPPRRRPTRAMLIDAIAEALNTDGATVDPKSIDTHGLIVVTCDGFRFRVELDEGELMDDDEWRHGRDPRPPAAEHDAFAALHDAFIGGNDDDYVEPPF
jgi:hypothetical protein